ncbi:MAG: succinate dehydrogenase cytochrome b subunit [Thiotrichales bacterium]|jgi:succinate dehydrogenase / fumarate reductase cytochrome b subunit|nr:succinate dehydrogenase cytochrome b subunit [Thiotrichales bacterium]MBT5290377.1 succinate dehydrogenase cytochrome b subunit [Thiotrichales bacterium]
MFRLIHLFKTSIGRKLVMALSGVVLLLFVVGHMVGNMTIYISPAAINGYSHWLQQNALLWPFRGFMLLMLALHLITALELARKNRAAAPVSYIHQNWFKRIIINYQMMISGIVVVLFLIFHIAHLTIGVYATEIFALLDENLYIDVYQRVVSGFQNVELSLLYIIAIGFLGIHLNHIIRALFQTLGFYHENYLSFLDILSTGLTLIIVAGFISIPLLVLLEVLV